MNHLFVVAAAFLGLSTVFAWAEDLEPVPEGEQVPIMYGSWMRLESKSPLDDSKTVLLINNSVEGISNNYGESGKATFTIRCMENSTNVLFSFNDNFMADIQAYGKIQYRVDTGKASQKRFRVSTDNMSLGLWSGRSAIPWIKSIWSGKNLFVRVTPFNQSPKSMNFNITGLETAIRPLRSACHW